MQFKMYVGVTLLTNIYYDVKNSTYISTVSHLLWLTNSRKTHHNWVCHIQKIIIRKIVLLKHIYNNTYGIFHGKSAAQNFKSSETWLNLFKIMKKRRNQFLARYMQMLKSYSNLKISKFWLFSVNGNFHDFF